MPEWARSLSPASYRALRDALNAEVDSRNRSGPLKLSLDEAKGRLTITGSGPAPDMVDLTDLARAAGGHGFGSSQGLEVADIVGAWMGAVLDAPAQADALLDDPARARNALRVRLVRAGDLEHAPALVSTAAFGDLVAVLLLELESSLATVPPARAGELGDVDSLFAQALENVAALDEPQVGEAHFEDGLRLVTVTSDSPYASCHALWPERFTEIGSDGALVALPTDNLLLIHPMVDAAAGPAMATLALEARHHYEIGPASLSGDVFWWRPGKVERVPTDLDGGTVHVRPSAELLDLLDRLAPNG